MVDTKLVNYRLLLFKFLFDLPHNYQVVETPLLHPEKFVNLGIDPPKGVLLFGPPGTGQFLVIQNLFILVGLPALFSFLNAVDLQIDNIRSAILQIDNIMNIMITLQHPDTHSSFKEKLFSTLSPKSRLAIFK